MTEPVAYAERSLAPTALVLEHVLNHIGIHAEFALYGADARLHIRFILGDASALIERAVEKSINDTLRITHQFGGEILDDGKVPSPGGRFLEMAADNLEQVFVIVRPCVR